MIRGQFIRGDGLVLPNNVTDLGCQTILAAALQHSVVTYYLGLIQGVYDPAMAYADITEPTIGTNGYARQALASSNVGWPTAGSLNGERFMRSKNCVFVPTGPGFDKSITRVALFDGATTAAGILAISSPLPAPVQLLAATDVLSRTFAHQLFLR